MRVTVREIAILLTATLIFGLGASNLGAALEGSIGRSLAVMVVAACTVLGAIVAARLAFGTSGRGRGVRAASPRRPPH